MSHFYGTLQGARGEATRCGHKSSGIEAHVACWHGAVRTSIVHNDQTGEDTFFVELVPWQGSGNRQTLASGTFRRDRDHDVDQVATSLTTA